MRLGEEREERASSRSTSTVTERRDLGEERSQPDLLQTAEEKKKKQVSASCRNVAKIGNEEEEVQRCCTCSPPPSAATAESCREICRCRKRIRRRRKRIRIIRICCRSRLSLKRRIWSLQGPLSRQRRTLGCSCSISAVSRHVAVGE